MTRQFCRKKQGKNGHILGKIRQCVMVAYLGKWASGHKVLSNIYGIEEVLSLACLMPIQDHKRKWMALLFWQFRKQLCSLTRLLPPSSPISGNPLLIRLHFYPFIFKPIFKWNSQCLKITQNVAFFLNFDISISSTSLKNVHSSHFIVSSEKSNFEMSWNFKFFD